MSQTLRAAIKRGRGELVAMASELIAIPTVNPPGADYLRCAAVLQRRLRDAGLRTRVIKIPRHELLRALPQAANHPRANVLARWNVGAKETVHFNAHYDVVPAASAGWRFGAFTPRVSRGWLYGRGAADMKGSIACVLHALRTLRRLHMTPSVNVEVSFTPDEETDSRFGADWIVNQGLIKADYVVVGEGGSGNRVGCGHNGVLWFEVDVFGRAAHGSEPRRGINAVELMSALVRELQTYQKQIARIRFRDPGGRERCATLNVGGVTATAPGGKINTVPAAVTFTIDRRVLPGENMAAAERDLRAFIREAGARIPRLRAKVRRVVRQRPTYIDPGHFFPQAFAAALRRVRRGPVRFTVSTGFNDTQFFVGDGRLPALGWGPGGENCHGNDERVKVAALIEAAQTYAEFLVSFNR